MLADVPPIAVTIGKVLYHPEASCSPPQTRKYPCSMPPARRPRKRQAAQADLGNKLASCTVSAKARHADHRR
jgi:hypothetical protein